MVAVCFGGPCSSMAYCYTRIYTEIRKIKKNLAVLSKTSLRNEEANEEIEEISVQKHCCYVSYSVAARDMTVCSRLSCFKCLCKAEVEENVATEAVDNPALCTVTSQSGDLLEIPQEDIPASAISITSRSLGLTSVTNSPDLNSSRSQNQPSPALHRKTRRRISRSPKKSNLRREEIRLTFSFFITMIVFIICWLPFCLGCFLADKQ